MVGELGNIVLWLSLATALYSAVAALLGIHRHDARWSASARNAVCAVPVLLGLAYLLLTSAFFDNRFELIYVSQHSSRALPLYLKLSAVWAGQEGSLLLWATMQGAFAALSITRPSEKMRPLVPWATVFLNLVTAFFIAVTLFISNPFIQTARVPPDGIGLNPLLRHPGMIWHPPAMYVGYVGVAVPFAFALAALAKGEIKDWSASIRTWNLIAWLGLGLGLFLGMRWAYDVLGWGGYWAWDPVENAGLMPWFTVTALLHGSVMQEERRGFHVWNFVLVIASFALVLFGTYATRSGVIQSVHAFPRTGIGNYFLAAIIVSLVGPLAVLIWRRPLLKSRQNSESLLSRDGLFFLTLVLFSTLTVSVFIGSVLPTLTGVLSGRQFEAGPAWFDRVTGPQFALLVLVMGICPLLGRSVQALRRLRAWKWPLLLGALLAPIAALIAGFLRPVSAIGFGVVGLAAAAVFVEFGEGVAARRRAHREAPLNAFWTLLRTQRRKYGGYLVHLGVVLMAIGVIGTRQYPFETEVVMRANENRRVGQYTLIFEGLQRESFTDYVSTWASVAVYRDDSYLATLQPRLNRYANYDQAFSVPALQPGLREDFYLVLGGWSDNGELATLKLMINPLINFMWLGGLIFFAGGALALWPKPTQQRLWHLVAAAAAVALLIGAGWSMWGTPHGTVVRTGGRPRAGDAAPPFRLTLLDGAPLSNTDLLGQVTVLNFWAPWCPSCREELPLLQQAWESYRQRGLTVVGVAIGSDQASVRASMAEHGLDFPIGLDVGDQIADAYGITGVPELYIVNAQGKVTYTHIGPVTQERLAAEIERVLNEEGR